MTENNQVTEDKPNQSSERKLKPLKKSLLDYNVTCARQEDVLLSEEPNLLFSWISKKSENKEPEKVMLCINDCSFMTYLTFIHFFHMIKDRINRFLKNNSEKYTFLVIKLNIKKERFN
jgi:hypothetical protein